jgi:hypothetical protein
MVRLAIAAVFAILNLAWNEGGSAMFWQSRLEKLAAQLRIHDIPACIALWNGSRFDLGESIKVIIRVLSPAGLRPTWIRWGPPISKGCSKASWKTSSTSPPARRTAYAISAKSTRTPSLPLLRRLE